MPDADTSRAAALIDRLFCRVNAPYGSFDRQEEPVALAGDLMYRVILRHEDDPPYELTLYTQIDGFAGDLWEQSARTLLKLRAVDHPALPRIYMANFVRGEQVAFTLTEERGRALGLDEAVGWAHEDPLEAFEQFSLLTDGLKRLHGSRTMHRLMLPSAFRAIVSDDGTTRLSLSRFEMSAVIGNVIRKVVGSNLGEVRSVVRDLYLPSADLPAAERARHLAYLAPEIHPYLFDENCHSRRDWDRTDIFGLGVFGWELFCGGLPQQLGPELAAVAEATGTETVTALASLHAAMRSRLERAHLPSELKSILGNMLQGSPGDRESSFYLAGAMEHGWDDIRSHWEERAEMPYLVAFMPQESVETLYNERHWISRSPLDSAGREELRAFYEDELDQAYLVHSLTGAEGYANGPSEQLRQAEWVLIGKRAVWFCAYFYDLEAGGAVKETHKDTLVIKYLREHEYARELYTQEPRRRIPELSFVAFRPGESLASARRGRESWGPLAESIRMSERRDVENERFLQSLDFLLEYLRAEMEARIYPYALDGREGSIAVLRYDERRDDEWRQRTPIFAAYASDIQRRPALGDFVSRLDSESWTQLQLDGAQSRPGFTGNPPSVRFESRRDAESIRVEVPSGVRVPTRGWLRPAADSGSRWNLDRQVRARQALENQAALVTQLRQPAPMGIGRQHAHLELGPDVEGNAPEVIREMLSRYPLYALQGPPGSGKTHAVTNAVKSYMDDEPGARVLVSAQSNYALDHLGERLIKALPDDLIVLREINDSPERNAADRISSDLVRQHTLTALTASQTTKIKDRLTRRLAKTSRPPVADDRKPLSPTERQLAQEWVDNVENGVELADRLRNAASVVLATCSGAATSLDGISMLTDPFDWVIIEEAAKAWPTELIIPLTLGTRWTLVGDHRQLGAFRGADVRRFLESLRDHPNEKVRLHYELREKRLEALNLFRTLFESGSEASAQGEAEPAASAAASRETRRRRESLGRLTMQFRMHEKIAEPVRRTFYQIEPEEIDDQGLPKSFLESYVKASRGHGVNRPSFLVGQPLVWVDTGDHPECADQPRWRNPGEVKLIERLVEQLDPASAPPGADGDKSLAILTPYREQLRDLQARDVLRHRVFTVHSFQGREADRVIVSLVRTTGSGGLSGSVGHVGQDEVINVLLSRAKRLLVLVGRFSHFQENGGPSWELITRIVEREGDVVPVSEWERP